MSAKKRSGYSSRHATWLLGTALTVSAVGANAVLAQGRDGYLYGTTHAGGKLDPVANAYCGGGASPNQGVAYRTSASGAFKKMYQFKYDTIAKTPRQPSGALVQGADGAIYGTTRLGGTNDRGTVYKLVIANKPPRSGRSSASTRHPGSRKEDPIRWEA